MVGTRRSSGSPADHPRSRGVYQKPVARLTVPTRSSPLARGLQERTARKGAAWQIIPARAGFTRCSPPRSPCGPDHPRSRGVYGDALDGDAGRARSSPLARGLRHLPGSVRPVGQIIPARAGFTRTHDLRIKSP